MKRKYYYPMVVLIIYCIAGCSPTIQSLVVDRNYKGFIPPLEVSNTSVLVRCYCSNYYNLDASAIFTEKGGKESAFGYWKHPWGSDFKANFIDSVMKIGFNPIDLVVPMQNERDISVLASEAEKRNCRYLLVAKSDIINEKHYSHWIKNFFRACTYGGCFLWWPAIADINSLLIGVENYYIVYDVTKKSIVLDKKYADEEKKEFRSFSARGDFPMEYVRARAEIFLSLQNKLTSLFWKDFINVYK